MAAKLLCPCTAELPAKKFRIPVFLSCTVTPITSLTFQLRGQVQFCTLTLLAEAFLHTPTIRDQGRQPCSAIPTKLNYPR